MASKFGYRGLQRHGRGIGPKLLAVYVTLAVELVLLAFLVVASLTGSIATVELGRVRVAGKPIAYAALATGAILGMVGTVSLSRYAREPGQAVLERQALATWASHQIRNPLAVISGCAQLMARADSPTGSQETARRILEQSARIDGALAQLVALGEPVLLQRALVDLRTLLQAAMASCERDFRAGGVTWEVDGSFGLVCGDPRLLEEALTNVLINSIESMDADGDAGWVRITGRLGAHATVIVVEDNGCGLLPQERARAFDIGYTTKPHALGMGLPMARAVLGVHGGTLHLEPRTGPGTRAVISLPHPES